VLHQKFLLQKYQEYNAIKNGIIDLDLADNE